MAVRSHREFSWIVVNEFKGILMVGRLAGFFASYLLQTRLVCDSIRTGKMSWGQVGQRAFQMRNWREN
jgi:hypothetical protein